VTYHLTTLANGLRIATEYLPGVETTSIAVSVGVGARYESLSENGISHLLEHMAFKGTKTRSARDIAESFDNIGGQLNAYTSMELTVYYAKVLSGDVPLAIDILADIMQNSIFDEAELAREKDVIIQEIGMHHDSPDDLIVDHFDITAFPDQPLGRSILGDAARVAGYSRNDVMGYMARHYVPGNMVVSAAGKIDHGQFVALVEKYLATAAEGSAPAAPIARYVGGEKRTSGDYEQLHVAMGFPAVTLHDPRYYALQLYASILGGGMSSRLFQEVREKRGLAYSVYAMGSAYGDVGMMNMYAATAPEKASELLSTLQAEIARMGDGVTDAEFTRAKNQSKAELLMAREGSQTVAGWIGRHLLIYGEYKQIAQIFARIDAVSKDDIRAMAALIAGGAPTLALLGQL
jgi:predicted Zn-dependent peptidase